MPASRATRFLLRRSAFTLVELMASIAVLTILVLMLSTLFNSASRAWITGESSTERRGSVRALADYIAVEMQGALLPVEGVSAVGKANLQFILNPSQVPQDCRNADAIFWQAPLATETSSGDIAEIGYFVKWPAGQGTRPTLCRFFVNPSVVDINGSPSPNP
jgi:prepilin-type N-terminal cleavage/methylation domain-containing protein